jgi:23S rRNA pseudouridine2457 synthase
VTLAGIGFPPGVYPIGRLDLDSEGMLLLSDEAGLNTRILDPKNAHPRTYHAQVEGEVTGEAIARLRDGGLVIQGHRTLPCSARRIEPSHPDRDPPIRYRAAIPTSWIELTLTEGKNRQVRRMTAAVGFPTLRLIRVAIGGLTLEATELPPGEWRELTAHERSLVVPKEIAPTVSRSPGRTPRRTGRSPRR